VAQYTSARIALFAVTVAVLALLGMRGLLLLLVAVVVSGLLSYVLLSRQRDAMSASVVRRSETMRQRMRERTEAEDAADDAARAERERALGDEGAEGPTGPVAGDDAAGSRSGQREAEPQQDGEG
jgi:hypothetical protein